MSGRTPNDVEKKLLQLASATTSKEITTAQCATIVPDPAERTIALNSLLRAGLFKVLKDGQGKVVAFRAVTKEERVPDIATKFIFASSTENLNDEESMVLSHIRATADEGIWTKHLKARTNLHQTVLDRCLKVLLQKKLVKHVPSVQASDIYTSYHPTRKIYMLSSFQPSVSLTGGAWYTDNELDTEFIKLVSSACLQFIRNQVCQCISFIAWSAVQLEFDPQTFPKHLPGHTQPLLYPLGNAPRYLTARDVQAFLEQSQISKTELSLEDVEMLLHVLVIDGQIEKLSSFGAIMWDPSALDDGDELEPAEQSAHRRKEKRKYTSDSEDLGKGAGSSSKSKGRKRTRCSAPVLSDTHAGEAVSTTRKLKGKRLSDVIAGDDNLSTDDESTRGTRRTSSATLAPLDLMDVGAHVYRAIREERASLGWSQTPCSHCPAFAFCDDRGPVNARECAYYRDWLLGGVAQTM
ncbi:putative DNA-directed RNA polymerase III subunit rpc6 [Grifola frondosa]|uniref:Putative DNA-directed RNA polymerase III subunit rpc6 n=1 Tax=Grifola frondosa TaxID=5627 RepID=A0A1C7MKX3_GRIFR|nr:putative DNA-directed RNA polymerase III subunit rpc6 [Grifola frondosa]